MPVAARLAPAPTVARSNTATDMPRSASRHAIDRPMTPAPTTATSTAAGMLALTAAAPCGVGLLPINWLAGGTACIKKSPLFSGGDSQAVVGAISNPYAGANRVRFKGFPRCPIASHAGPAVSQPLVGDLPW